MFPDQSLDPELLRQIEEYADGRHYDPAAEPATNGQSLESNPQAQGLMMLAAAISQLSAALWGLSEALRGPPISAGLPNLSSRHPADASGLERLGTALEVRIAAAAGVISDNTSTSSNAANGAPAVTAAAAEAKPIQYPMVQKALQDVAHDLRYGHTGALGVLKRFGVDHGQALEASQYADVVAACQALLAGASH